MKVIVIVVLAACVAATTAALTNPLTNYVNGECVSGYNANIDQQLDVFPNKYTLGQQLTTTIAADYSLFWNVTYHGTYKILRNSYSGHQMPTAVLYQCGTPRPNLTDLGDVTYWEVPVTRVAATSSTYIPLLEMLGERQALKAYTSSFDLLSSPCVLRMHEEGSALSAAAGWSINNTLLQELNIDLTIADSWTSTAYNAYVMTDTAEDSILKTAEYVELVALFFNREAEATQIMNSIVDEYQCTRDLAAETLTNTAGNARPKVLWANWAWDSSASAGGWSVGTCPNYYCEVITAAGGEVIQVPLSVTPEVTLFGSYPYLSTAQLVSIASDADLWLCPDNFNATSSQFGIQNVATIRAVQLGQVYDAVPQGSINHWFEARFSQPHVFAQDVASILFPEQFPSYVRVLWRHYMDPIPAFSAADAAATCSDTSAALMVPTGNVCSALTTVTTVTTVTQQQEADNARDVKMSLWVVASLFATLTVCSSGRL